METPPPRSSGRPMATWTVPLSWCPRGERDVRQLWSHDDQRLGRADREGRHHNPATNWARQKLYGDEQANAAGAPRCQLRSSYARGWAQWARPRRKLRWDDVRVDGPRRRLHHQHRPARSPELSAGTGSSWRGPRRVLLARDREDGGRPRRRREIVFLGANAVYRRSGSTVADRAARRQGTPVCGRGPDGIDPEADDEWRTRPRAAGEHPDRTLLRVEKAGALVPMVIVEPAEWMFGGDRGDRGGPVAATVARETTG